MLEITDNLTGEKKLVYEIARNYIEEAVKVDPDVELATAIASATTLQQLKDALLGSGKLAKVDAKRK